MFLSWFHFGAGTADGHGTGRANNRIRQSDTKMACAAKAALSPYICRIVSRTLQPFHETNSVGYTAGEFTSAAFLKELGL